MSSIKNSFVVGFEKIAGLPKWLHEREAHNATVKGQSKAGLKGLMKRRGVLVAGVTG